MSESCFVCGRPARYYDAATRERLCVVHRSITEPSPYIGPRYRDEIHARRLLSFRGPERTARILAGEDPETEADLAGWRRLGALAEAG